MRNNTQNSSTQNTTTPSNQQQVVELTPELVKQVTSKVMELLEAELSIYRERVGSFRSRYNHYGGR